MTDSIVTFDDWCFTPSPNKQYLLNDEHDVTVMEVHALVKRASLPVDTFVLAALILRSLKPEFYDNWYETLEFLSPQFYDHEATKEVVIIAAIV